MEEEEAVTAALQERKKLRPPGGETKRTRESAPSPTHSLEMSHIHVVRTVSWWLQLLERKEGEGGNG